MALPATLRRLEIDLSDADRGLYARLEWVVAQHPSESDRYLVARIIARALEHADGLEFCKGGVSDDQEPALVQRDLRGTLTAWIEIGTPAPDRLHKAGKACPRVVVYTWKSPERLAESIRDYGVYRAANLELYALPVELLDGVAASLERNNRWAMAVSGRVVFLTIGDAFHQGEVRSIQL